MIKKLKIGLLLNSNVVHAYQATFIHDLLNDSRFDITCLLFFNAPGKATSPAKSSFNTWFWNGWAKRFLYPKSEAHHCINLSEALSSYPQIEARFNINESFSYVAEEKTLDLISDLHLDVIINCQQNDLCGRLLSLPRLGVWSLYLGDEQKYSRGSTGFWEVYFKQPLCSASLQRLTDTPNTAIILRKGHFKTDPLMLQKTRDKLLFESALWFKSCLAECWNDFNAIHHYAPIKTTAKPHQDPNNGQIIWFLLKLSMRRLTKSIQDHFSYVAWNIAILPLPLEKITASDIEAKATWLPELSWPRFQADPFGVEIDQQPLIFFEEGDHEKSIGEIKALTLSPSLNEIARVKIKTNVKCHQSYPFVFKDKGRLFVIPESLQSKQCVLYEVIDTLGTLKKHAILLDGIPVIDPSLIYINDYYWIFCTISSPYTDGNSSLFIFYSKTLEGPYQPHLLNPVKSDIRCSRPAGAFFFRNGKLCRPSQDCSRTYGGAITILEIQQLSSHEFSEQIIDHLKPHSHYPEGIHSLSPLGNNYTLIDGKRLAFSIKKALSNIIPSKDTFPSESLTALSPLTLETKLYDFNAISNHFLTKGIDNDCWCAKKVDLVFRAPEHSAKLRLNIDFPGWQPRKKQCLTFRINDKLLLKTNMQPGSDSIELPLLTSDSAIKISIEAKSKFRMPFPDSRHRAFQVREIGFVN
jgi:hypothetical protein